MFKLTVCFLSMLLLSPSVTAELLPKQTFTESDAVLVVKKDQGEVFNWRATQAMVPASLTKLATAHLAIDKWSIDHAFHTDFYTFEDQLWVKGFGDPYLVSEELDLLVAQLQLLDLTAIKQLNIDGSYFANEVVPGRSSVNDPYNAPLSAVAANFNTVVVSKLDGEILSTEAQTPLTETAKKIASLPKYGLKGSATVKSQRLNLRNTVNAKTHFAQLLKSKLAKPEWRVSVDGEVPAGAAHIYRYTNTHDLPQIIRGMLEYSNNFMANQLFLTLADGSLLAEGAQLTDGETLAKGTSFANGFQKKTASFTRASSYAEQQVQNLFGWAGHQLVEGSGLSRSNQLSANQLDDLLIALEPYKHLFKKVANAKADIHAKTGTLDGVRSFAGYIDFEDASFRFVFLFNRKVPWRYRETLLKILVDQLALKEGL